MSRLILMTALLGALASAAQLAEGQEARLWREAQMRSDMEAARDFRTRLDYQALTEEQYARAAEIGRLYTEAELARLRARARRRAKVSKILTQAQRELLAARRAKELEAIRYARWAPPAAAPGSPGAEVERARLLAARRRVELQVELVNTPRTRDLIALGGFELAPEALAKAFALDARQQQALCPALFRALQIQEDAYHALRRAPAEKQRQVTVAFNLGVAKRALAVVVGRLASVLRPEQAKKLPLWRSSWHVRVRKRFEDQRRRRERWTPSGQAVALLGILQERAQLEAEAAAAIKPRVQALIELQQGKELDAYSAAMMAIYMAFDPAGRRRGGAAQTERDAGWISDQLAVMRRTRKTYEAKLRATERRLTEVLTVEQEATLVSRGSIR